jgi:hypothetical protein
MDEPDPANKGLDCDMNHQTEPTAQEPHSPARDAMLEADLQAHIGRQLRAVYDEVVNEEVPDRFRKLLEELERKQAERS